MTDARERGPTFGDLLAWARGRLPQPGDARWIVAEVAQRGLLESLAPGPAPEGAAKEVSCLVERRAAGEPLQYVLGHWGFRTLDLRVDRRVLVPRPETEQVVEVALAQLAPRARGAGKEPAPAGRDDHGGPLVADLGTGSGAIALSIASEVPEAQVWATDASPDALAVAGANCSSLGLGSRVRLAAGSWYDALPPALRGRLSLIVSNPPYVAQSEVAGLPGEVRDFEPRTALVPGPTGLEAIAEVLTGAPGWLCASGAVVVEMAPHQAGACAGLARSCGLAGVEVHEDLAGRQRVLVARAVPFGSGPKKGPRRAADRAGRLLR